MQKATVVTGASSGIGAAICKRLLKDGDLVFGLGRDAAKLRPLQEAGGGNFVPVVCDVLDRQRIKDACGEILARAPKLHLLVNNAGVLRFGESHAFTDEDMDLQIDTMLVGTLLVTRALLPGLLAEGGGLVINIASVSGEMASPKMAVYGAVKAGLINFTQTLAAEYAEQKLRAVCINPGTVQTNLMNKFLFASLAKNVPLKRLAKADEIAACVAYLRSDEASYMTGSAIRIDGGVAL